MRLDLSGITLAQSPGIQPGILSLGVIYSPDEQYRLKHNNAPSASTLEAAGYSTGEWLVKAGAAALEPWIVPENGWLLPLLQEACQQGRARLQNEGDE